MHKLCVILVVATGVGGWAFKGLSGGCSTKDMLHLVGGKHDHRVAIENQQAQCAHNGWMRGASAGAGAKQAVQLHGVQAMTPELSFRKMTILKWLLLQQEGYNMKPSLSPCFNYATSELWFFKDGEKKVFCKTEIRNISHFKFHAVCCFYFLLSPHL